MKITDLIAEMEGTTKVGELAGRLRNNKGTEGPRTVPQDNAHADTSYALHRALVNRKFKSGGASKEAKDLDARVSRRYQKTDRDTKAEYNRTHPEDRHESHEEGAAPMMTLKEEQEFRRLAGLTEGAHKNVTGKALPGLTGPAIADGSPHSAKTAARKGEDDKWVEKEQKSKDARAARYKSMGGKKTLPEPEKGLYGDPDPGWDRRRAPRRPSKPKWKTWTSKDPALKNDWKDRNG